MQQFSAAVKTIVFSTMITLGLLFVGTGVLHLVNPPPAIAQTALPGQGWVPLGYQQITSLSAATALTVPTGATRALIIAETQAVRYRDDGTNPTASVGQPLAVAAVLDYVGTLANIKFIEQTASAKLNISYYR